MSIVESQGLKHIVYRLIDTPRHRCDDIREFLKNENQSVLQERNEKQRHKRENRNEKQNNNPRRKRRIYIKFC